MARRDHFVHALFAVLVLVPPLAVIPGFGPEGLLFVLYREPKLAAVRILGWAFLAALVLVHGRRLWAGLGMVLRRPPLLLLAAFLVWGGASAPWARVPANVFYEWDQYLLLFALGLGVGAWARLDPRVLPRLGLWLVLAMLVPVALAFLQLLVELPWLRSIDPGYGVRHASVMGYKNPMALALLGQFFLLAGLVHESFRKRRDPFLRGALIALLVAELSLLLSLKSRTAWLALSGSGCALLALWPARSGRRAVLVRAACAVLLLGIGVGLLWVSPATRDRLGSLGEYLAHPARALDSDRGTYLRNTLVMVRDHPWGVGLGEWQTWYPLYRQHNPRLSFTDAHQVRRAHSDPVQFLGELGWVGLALWLAILAAGLLTPWRRFRSCREEGGSHVFLFVMVQVLALSLAMGTDYLVEMPYGKFQFFLVWGLAVLGGQERAVVESGGPLGSGRHRALVAGVTAVALGQFVLAGQDLAREHASGMLLALDRRLVQADSAQERARLLDAIAEQGKHLDHLVGHSKTSYRDPLVLAHAALFRGQRQQAIGHLRQALRLHPYHPESYRLLALALEDSDPEGARHCAEIYSRLMAGGVIDLPGTCPTGQ